MYGLTEGKNMANRLIDSLAYQPVELAFGTSGLRGLVTDMTDLECYINTVGFMEFLLGSGDIPAGDVICLAGDLRDSTPRIMQVVAQAITDSGCPVENYGLIPTPAIAHWSLQHGQACIMVTGSHIPADRNGIKFYKREGEVLKPDEAPIKEAVKTVRERLYGQAAEESPFDGGGRFKGALPVHDALPGARQLFKQRFSDVFTADTFAGKKIVVYQHSAVGRDLIVEVLQALGAEAIPVDKSDVFIPIDTENVTPDNQAYFRSLAQSHPDTFAIVSTDGDSDRPFVIDETGTFHRGDVLGAVVAQYLAADFAAVPVSANDAVDIHLQELGVPLVHTKIGSPYVVTAMQAAATRGHARIVGWEVNGGFLLGSDFALNNQTLAALPTRDAFLPILCALHAAIRQNCTVSELFGRLPKRYTQAGLIDNFPVATSRAIVQNFSEDTAPTRARLERFFGGESGFDSIKHLDATDGIRISFSNGDIAHIRPSGNAPQLRVYSVAGSQERADAIVADAIAEPDGLLRQLEKTLT